MSDLTSLLTEIQAFQGRIEEVATERDLWTATQRGAELNRIVSQFDRKQEELSTPQRALLGIAHQHVHAMMNCPRRMRLDDTWQDDFAGEARAAADALVSLVGLGESSD